MTAMLSASLVVNIAVLLPVTLGLLFDVGWVRGAFGPKQPGRQILLAIYMAIFFLSAALLFRPDVGVATGLLLAQVIYKVLTPLTVGTLKNPVVVSNLAIAALHVATLFALYSPA